MSDPNSVAETRRSSAFRPAGLTLIELLVVVAIVGALIGVLLPAVQAARERSRCSQCGFQMRQAALAALSHAERFTRLPPSHTVEPEPPRGLFPLILDGLGYTALRDAYKFDKPWNDSANARATAHHIPELVCPTTPETREQVTDYVPAPTLSSTLYQPLVAQGAITQRREWRSMLQPQVRVVTAGSVRDGMSNSFMLFEAAGRPTQYKNGSRTNGVHGGAHWASDGSSTGVRRFCNETQLANCENIQGVYSFHPGGCNYAFGDSAVRFLDETMDPEVWVSHFTMAAGD